MNENKDNYGLEPTPLCIRDGHLVTKREEKVNEEDPRWHGWATPDNVREMMQEMYQFLKENNELCQFMTTNAPTAAPSRMSGQESKKTI